ncbi:MobF family relaxase [Sandaracinobacteroides hominis]|uniref:MobF family relaxase n=1 Tax=Sandaracinobacteroides hominis TaxID=2780086 RepID=UPI0018F36A92|nr:MobF family relaxase [Sandaracinobacteroides hominis]
MSATLAHQGLPPGIVRKDLLSLVENLGKRGLGISSTAFCVLHHYVFRSRDSDYRQGRICAVWEKVSGTAERLGLCSRGVNEAERELERKGLLVRTTGGNGARSGMRAGESIRWAAGINLAPLIGRFTELQLIRDAQLLHQQAVIETKADIRRIRRKIRETQNPDLHQKSEDILPSGRVAPIADLPRLQAILTALEAVFESLSDESGRQISSDAPEEMFRPNIQNNRSRTCTSNREGAVTPEIALELASPAYRELVATKGGATWPNLVETSRQMVGAIGISQGAWGSWVEKNLLEARVWDRSAKVQLAEPTGKIAAAVFQHDVNRNGDPQLHSHAVILNATIASDGKWHAIHNDKLYLSQHLIGAVFNAELRSRVEALGYETIPAANPIGGSFEIAGVTRGEIEAFSTRRTEILEALAKEDRGSPRVAQLSSPDRVQLVQGGAGVGKSAALAPVAVIAREEGRNVFALSHVGRIARELGEKVGEKGSTVDTFLGRYAAVLESRAGPDRMASARAELSDAVIMVDEASMIGNERLLKLVDLSNKLDVGRLILAGDVKQLPAIEAGKPFELLQNVGVPTGEITENLRATTPQMRDLNAALGESDISRAFVILRPDTVEVPHGRTPIAAARLWAKLPIEEREQTILLASGRAMRSAANEAVQAELLAKGELGPQSLHLTVLDRVRITREGARQLKGYREGRIVEFRTNLPSQGFQRGDRGTVQGIEDHKVRLQMADGSRKIFTPERLPRNLAHDAVSIFQPKDLELHAGDRIRWTDKDPARGTLNGDIAQMDSVGPGGVTVTTSAGQRHDIPRNDPALERLDLAYAVNVHVAQGMTAKNGIILMSERERTLNSTRTFLVAVTRIAEHATLVVDSAKVVERSVARNAGSKTSAHEASNKGRFEHEEREPLLERGHGGGRGRDFER